MENSQFLQSFGPFLNGVAERDIDLLLLEECQVNDVFVTWFCESLGFAEIVFGGAWRSVSNSYGETDLLLLVCQNGKRIGILIENKINASEQDQQSARYQIRGTKLQEAGTVDAFATIICAPKVYLDGLPAESRYDHCLEYERIAEWFAGQCDRRSKWRHYVLVQAIEQAKRGYQMIVDPARTAFQKAYWRYLRAHYPHIKMAEPKERGGMSYWIIMKGSGFPRGVQLHHKFNSQTIELGFNGHFIEELLAAKSDWRDEGIHVVQKGQTASLVVDVPAIDMKGDFESQLPEVEEALRAVHRLTPYAVILTPAPRKNASGDRRPAPEEVVPSYLDRLEKLLPFLPVFEEPGFVFGKLADNKPGQFPWYNLTETAQSFVQAAYEADCLLGFDWPEWSQSDHAEQLQNDLEAVSTACPEDISKLLTCYIRADRFMDGTLVKEYERGSLTAILRRIKALVQDKAAAVAPENAWDTPVRPAPER